MNSPTGYAGLLVVRITSISPFHRRSLDHALGGQLVPDWNPAYAGGYNLVWALHAEGLRLHTGGEFKTVSGITQNSYARLSPASIKGTIKGDARPNTLTGTPNNDAIYGYGGPDRIDARSGDDALRLGDGSDEGRGGVATTISVRWMGPRTTSFVALALIASKPTQGTTSRRGVRKSKGPAKGSTRED
jgi:RTX calcium-binding nonapeptide repeat (4 copies)